MLDRSAIPSLEDGRHDAGEGLPVTGDIVSRMGSVVASARSSSTTANSGWIIGLPARLIWSSPHFRGVAVDVVVLGRIRLSAPIGKKTTDSRPAQTSAAAVTDVIRPIATPIWVAATMKGSDVA